MQITMPNTPETLSYAMLGTVGINLLLALLLIARGDWLGVILVLAVAAGVYWFLCRHTVTVVPAPNAAAAGAVVLVLAAVADLAGGFPYHGILFLLAGAALGFVYVLLRQGALPFEMRFGNFPAVELSGQDGYLVMLAALRDAGILTAEEFAAKVGAMRVMG